MVFIRRHVKFILVLAAVLIGSTWYIVKRENVTFLDSNRPISQGIDHSILYDTQQDALEREFKDLEEKYGFYKKAR